MTETELMKEVGSNIQNMMDEWGMTQKELADATGISKSTISRYISGDLLPSLKNLLNIAYELECDTTDLLPPDERIV